LYYKCIKSDMLTYMQLLLFRHCACLIICFPQNQGVKKTTWTLSSCLCLSLVCFLDRLWRAKITSIVQFSAGSCLDCPSNSVTSMLALSTLVFEEIHIGFQGVVVDDLVNASRSHARLQHLGSSGTVRSKHETSIPGSGVHNSSR
jgi:hypothetical protein